MLDKNKSNLESEIKLMKLKEKLKEAEELEDARESYFISTIFGTLGFAGFALFVFIKKLLDEYWIYAFSLLAFLAAVGLLLIVFSYKWKKQAKEEVKKLEKEIQRERERERAK